MSTEQLSTENELLKMALKTQTDALCELARQFVEMTSNNERLQMGLKYCLESSTAGIEPLILSGIIESGKK